jgi:hypothetical protein
MVVSVHVFARFVDDDADDEGVLAGDHRRAVEDALLVEFDSGG